LPKKKRTLWGAMPARDKAADDRRIRRGESARRIGDLYDIDWISILSLTSRNTSDWAFALQAVALVETALNASIANVLHVRGAPEGDNEKLRKCIEHLPLLDGKASKVQFAKAAKFLPQTAEDFINKLAFIRNFYAHSMKNGELSLFEVMNAKGKKTTKAEYRKAFNLQSDWEILKDDPQLLREEISETLFSHLLYWPLLC